LLPIGLVDVEPIAVFEPSEFQHVFVCGFPQQVGVEVVEIEVDVVAVVGKQRKGVDEGIGGKPTGQEEPQAVFHERQVQGSLGGKQTNFGLAVAALQVGIHALYIEHGRDFASVAGGESSLVEVCTTDRSRIIGRSHAKEMGGGIQGASIQQKQILPLSAAPDLQIGRSFSTGRDA